MERQRRSMQPGLRSLLLYSSLAKRTVARHWQVCIARLPTWHATLKAEDIHQIWSWYRPQLCTWVQPLSQQHEMQWTCLKTLTIYGPMYPFTCFNNMHTRVERVLGHSPNSRAYASSSRGCARSKRRSNFKNSSTATSVLSMKAVYPVGANGKGLILTHLTAVLNVHVC